MNQSPEINHLMQALMEVHKEFGVVISKDSKGHKGTYASLPCVLESIHKMINKHGLVLTQRSYIEANQNALETTLYHVVSKQFRTCVSILTYNPEAQNADQVWGGSTTYHRRYDAMMLLGIFAEDDPTDHDGNHGQSGISSNSTLINPKQLALLRAKLGADQELTNKIIAGLRIAKLEDMPWKELNRILEYIEKQKGG